ncbi:MAG: hypothetical protein PVH26_03285, partial [Desulfosarcina sp.]
MKHHAWVAIVICALGLVGMAPTAAATEAVAIPDPLKPWEAWVLHDAGQQRCPSHFDDAAQRRCWWPSRLAVDAGDQGAVFDLQVSVYAPTWVSLPGGDTHWPESVGSGKTVLPVVDRNGRPSVWLTAGDYRIKGAMVWDRLPEVLRVPPEAGIVSLTVDGEDIVEPDLDRSGRLRLYGKGGAVTPEDTMTASLFRLIEDDIPMRVTTLIRLHVSGRPRDIRLIDLLPAAAAVMNIDSPLPARLVGDRTLLVQARPGRWNIRVTVRLSGPVTSLSAGNGHYGDEVWSFKAFNHLRMVKVRGAPSLEPARTRMPEAWRKFPAYLLTSGNSLIFDVLRRGDPDPAPDQLSLDRTWWLDFDGSGFTIHDRIRGTLNRSWHLSMAEPVQLGRVSVDGRDQLITMLGDRPAPGVQLRRGRLSLKADSRMVRTASDLPAIGWDHDFQRVSGVLNLPPGWTLFSAAGVDVPPGAWLQRWTLLDFFLVLIISFSTYKLRNRLAGALILLTLLLIFHEPGAPIYIWLHLLAASALLKYLPGGWFRTCIKLWRGGAVLALIVIGLPFMVQQVRSAIFPQLAPPGHRVHSQPATADLGHIAEEAPAAAPALSSVAKQSLKATAADVSKRQITPRQRRFTADPNALIQTGPGLPAWQWRSMPMRWNGPVDSGQRIHLWLISPAMNLALGLGRVVLLLVAIALFLDLGSWRQKLPASWMGGLTALIAMGLLLIPAPSLQAETTAQRFPPQPLLDELRQRLLEPPACTPHCADVSRLELAATPDQLRLIMRVHAAADTAIPLPSTLETWRPGRILLNNQPVKRLSRDERGALWMVVPQGVHRVKMIGSPGNSDEIRLSFPIRPHVGTYAGVGWQARGFEADGTMDATISLIRTATGGLARPAIPKTDIGAYFQVIRTLHLGIQWEVTTQVKRLTEPGKPAVLSVPLLGQAAVTTPGIRVADGVARVSLGPEAMQAEYASTLPVTSSITLTAPQDVPWTETWILDAATIWQCRVSGLTVTHHQDAGRNWQPQWRPWPGEQVRIDVTRPKAVPGRTVTVDSARLTLTPGQRFSRAELLLSVRSSKGGHHQVELPELANLQAVALNGKNLPIRQDGRLVTIPLEPGSQSVTVTWLQLSKSMILLHGPRIHIGDTAVNAAVTIQMPDNRWILLTGGPRLGPAVLFWSYLIVVILIAVGLGQTTLTPLRLHHWVLLGLGLTQVPAAVAIVVVGWLLALGYRGRRTSPRTWLFNTVQLLLVILTLAAMAGLYTAVERGLLGIPDMQIAGNGSTRFQLNWTQDRIDGILPTPWVLSLPQWV